MKPSKWKFAAALYLVGVLLIHALVFWNARELVWKGYPDFTIYYCAGTIVRQGLGPHLYEEATQFKVQKGFAPDVAIRLGALPYNHPPFEGLYFLPFTYLPYRTAFIFWGLANLAMLMALPLLLRPHLPELRIYCWPLWVLASLAFFPIFFALLQGQDTILLLFLYTLAFALLKKNHDTVAGVSLTLGLFKFHLVLPFVLLLLVQGRKRILYGFLSTATVLAVASVAVVGWHGITSYPHYVLQVEETMARGAIVPSDMPNLRGVLYLLLHGGPHVGVVALVLSVAILLFTAWRCFGVADPEFFDSKFSLGVLATVLVSYHASGYDLSILMLPVLLLANELLGKGRAGGWPARLMFIAAAVFFVSPLQLFLLMKAKRLALVGWAVLLWWCGIVGHISTRIRHHPSARIPATLPS